MAALFALLIAHAAGEFARHRAVEALEARAAQAAILLDSAITNEVGRYRAVPLVLARDAELAGILAGAMPADAFNARLDEMARRLGAAAIYAVRADGTTVAASNAGRPGSFIGQRYTFRRYFTDALRDGSAAQFALGTTTLRPGLYLSQRVDGPAGPLGVVVVKVELLGVEEEWARAGTRAFVTGEDGQVIVTSIAPWRFRALADLPIAGPPHASLVRLPAASSTEPHVVARRPSAIAGWTVHVLQPHVPDVPAAVGTARGLGLLAASLAMTAGWIGWRRQRRRREDAQRRLTIQARLEATVAERTRELVAANASLEAAMRDQRQAEARARELSAELEQANRLTTLGMIAAGVTHEIGQPVAAIRATAHNGLAQLERGAAAEARQSLARIDRLTERIGSITEALKGFARKGHGPRARVLVDEAVAEAEALLRWRIRQAGVRLLHEPGPTGLAVEAERVRLEQILANLLQNAIDALDGRPTPEIRIRTRREGGRAIVEVSDNGPGVPPAIEAALFLPFTTSKERGSGLGLAISRDIATALGGELVHVPTPAGATFRLSLPEAPDRDG
ncbi:MAG: ATP-binding protein [Sphingomonadaceae bacterium]